MNLPIVLATMWWSRLPSHIERIPILGIILDSALLSAFLKSLGLNHSALARRWEAL